MADETQDQRRERLLAEMTADAVDHGEYDAPAGEVAVEYGIAPTRATVEFQGRTPADARVALRWLDDGRLDAEYDPERLTEAARTVFDAVAAMLPSAATPPGRTADELRAAVEGMVVRATISGYPPVNVAGFVMRDVVGPLIVERDVLAARLQARNTRAEYAEREHRAQVERLNGRYVEARKRADQAEELLRFVQQQADKNHDRAERAEEAEAERDEQRQRADAAEPIASAAESAKATDTPVQIAGVRIEPCDEYGRTASTRRAERAEARVAELEAFPVDHDAMRRAAREQFDRAEEQRQRAEGAEAEADRANRAFDEMYRLGMRTADHGDRYRLAWQSARRRANRLRLERDELIHDHGQLDAKGYELYVELGTAKGTIAVHEALIRELQTRGKALEGIREGIAEDAATIRRKIAVISRVRALADEYEADARREGHGGELWSATATAIRAALDGTDGTGGFPSNLTPEEHDALRILARVRAARKRVADAGGTALLLAELDAALDGTPWPPVGGTDGGASDG